MEKIRKKQILIFIVLSLFGAIAGIIHGIYFDLDISQIKRLSILGIIFTSGVIFPSILFLEHVFDWNNQYQINQLKERIDKIEQILKIQKGKK